MNKLITAKFSSIDTAEHAAREIRSSILAPKTGKLSIVWNNTGINNFTDEPVAILGLAGYSPYYSGIPGAPFFNQYAVPESIPMMMNVTDNNNIYETSHEALLRLSCSESSVGAFRSCLLSLGAYEIHVQ